MTRSWSRRTFLRTTGGTALALGLTAGPLPADQAVAASASASASAADFSALRAKWRTLILGEGFSPTAEPFRTKLAALGARAGEHRSAMAPATGSLWPDLVWADPEPDTDQESFGYSARLVDSLNRLSTMAQAYCQQGTGLTGNAALRDAVVTGLDHIHARVYHENQARYGNWWSWQIGGPQALLDVCVLMYDQLSATQIANHCRAVDHFVPDSAVAAYTGTSTGANRVDLCRVLILRGIVGGSAAKIALGRDALSPVFPYVTSGDGLYADGSFVQHGTISYTGSYGAVMLGGLGALFSLLAGSGWAVTDPGRQIVLDAVENMPITAPPEPGADARFSAGVPSGGSTAPCMRRTLPWAASVSTSRRRVTAETPSSAASCATRRLPRSRTSASTRSWRWSTCSRMGSPWASRVASLYAAVVLIGSGQYARRGRGGRGRRGGFGQGPEMEQGSEAGSPLRSLVILGAAVAARWCRCVGSWPVRRLSTSGWPARSSRRRTGCRSARSCSPDPT